jgi:RNA polymerase sigma-70 factor (ECF subfamily)
LAPCRCRRAGSDIADASPRSDDLALARACAAGDEAAWERFVREYRPILYRAADALAPGGGARDLADSIYADLFSRDLFRYFQGRSSLATWLRAVLSQRYVDRLRADRRLEPLPDDEGAAPAAATATADPERPRWVAAMRNALQAAMARLAPRDRLRLGCYYVQELTLAETGKLLRESEATVSRQLSRTRKVLREAIETDLRAAGLDGAQIQACAASLADDAGPLDLKEMLARN